MLTVLAFALGVFGTSFVSYILYARRRHMQLLSTVRQIAMRARENEDGVAALQGMIERTRYTVSSLEQGQQRQLHALQQAIAELIGQPEHLMNDPPRQEAPSIGEDLDRRRISLNDAFARLGLGVDTSHDKHSDERAVEPSRAERKTFWDHILMDDLQGD
jgi:hypothetical protein